MKCEKIECEIVNYELVHTHDTYTICFKVEKSIPVSKLAPFVGRKVLVIIKEKE